jgi:hypothetical protein
MMCWTLSLSTTRLKLNCWHQTRLHFWSREWQSKWRKEQYVRLFDVITIKCKGQALLSVEEVGIDNASSLKCPKEMMKHRPWSMKMRFFKERDETG